MSRIRFDQLAKQYLEGFLEPLGEVRRNLEIPGEPKFVDVWFTPRIPIREMSSELGLLTRMAKTPCLIEPFRNSPTSNEVRVCSLKLLWVQEEHRRQAERNDEIILEKNLPKLWILGTSITKPLILKSGARLKRNGLTGIYFTPLLYRTVIVAIDKLPVTPDTLWLRILGRDAVQEQAINELLNLPKENPYRSSVLQLLVNWRITQQINNLEKDPEEENLMTVLSPAYLEWEQRTKQEGRQEGRQEGQISLLLRQITRRVGEVPLQIRSQIATLSIEKLESLGEALLDFQAITDLSNWLETNRVQSDSHPE